MLFVRRGCFSLQTSAPQRLHAENKQSGTGSFVIEDTTQEGPAQDPSLSTFDSLTTCNFPRQLHGSTYQHFKDEKSFFFYDEGGKSVQFKKNK